MTHGHGTEPPEKGTIHAGHQPAGDPASKKVHGHSEELKFDVIPEGSTQDKVLVFVAVLALCLLIVFGWSMATAKIATTAPQEQSSQHP